jgi:hypothetical protein
MPEGKKLRLMEIERRRVRHVSGQSVVYTKGQLCKLNVHLAQG